MSIRVAILWFWCVGSLAKAGTPPSKVPLVPVDVSDFSMTYDNNVIDKIWTSHTMAPYLQKALDCLRCSGARDTIKTYHGSYARRKISGIDKWSKHSWALAIDLNWGLTQPEILIDCFESAGFIWGGRWEKRPDPMHFEIGDTE